MGCWDETPGTKITCREVYFELQFWGAGVRVCNGGIETAGGKLTRWLEQELRAHISNGNRRELIGHASSNAPPLTSDTHQ